jgi:ABC-type glycerol-3-phosphate transport system permease component
MVTNSFSETRGILDMPPRLIPKEPTSKNYEKIFALELLPRWIGNTIIVAISVVTISVWANGMAGYVFAFARFKGKNVIFWIAMMPMFVTRFSILISQFIVVGKLGLSPLISVIVIILHTPAGIYLFRNYFLGIPSSIIQSARIDGAGEMMILRKIILPISGPIVGAVATFQGIGALGDFIWQLLNLQDPKTQTYIVGMIITTIKWGGLIEIGYNLAVGTMIFLPFVILFVFTSRYFFKAVSFEGEEE